MTPESLRLCAGSVRELKGPRNAEERLVTDGRLFVKEQGAGPHRFIAAKDFSRTLAPLRVLRVVGSKSFGSKSLPNNFLPHVE